MLDNLTLEQRKIVNNFTRSEKDNLIKIWPDPKVFLDFLCEDRNLVYLVVHTTDGFDSTCVSKAYTTLFEANDKAYGFFTRAQKAEREKMRVRVVPLLRSDWRKFELDLKKNQETEDGFLKYKFDLPCCWDSDEYIVSEEIAQKVDEVSLKVARLNRDLENLKAAVGRLNIRFGSTYLNGKETIEFLDNLSKINLETEELRSTINEIDSFFSDYSSYRKIHNELVFEQLYDDFLKELPQEKQPKVIEKIYLKSRLNSSFF